MIRNLNFIFHLKNVVDNQPVCTSLEDALYRAISWFKTISTDQQLKLKSLEISMDQWVVSYIKINNGGIAIYYNKNNKQIGAITTTAIKTVIKLQQQQLNYNNTVIKLQQQRLNCNHRGNYNNSNYSNINYDKSIIITRTTTAVAPTKNNFNHHKNNNYLKILLLSKDFV
ncbi:hypothetical protein ACTA71_011832 [Dictyostelium dimigraforme]